MRRVVAVWLAIAAGAALVAVAALGAAVVMAAAAEPSAGAGKAVAKSPARSASHPDSSLGLSRTSVFAVPAPPAIAQPTSDPGQKPKLPRGFAGAPPQIPHAIADFLPITRAQNQCLECHDKVSAIESGAVPAPASHYRDLRRAPTAERKMVAGARYVCVGCHVPQTDAPPLVGNRFGR